MNRLVVLTLGIVVLAGCSKYEPAPVKAPPPEPTVEAPPAPAPALAKPPEMVQKKAEVGVGAKGHGYGVGPVATPVASLYNAKERIAFDIQIRHAMDLFKAGNGRAPKTHEEFMREIIKANNIKLPTLPEGQRYMYDPKREELMVEQPAP